MEVSLLRGERRCFLGEKAKEDLIRQALSRVEGTKEAIRHQVSSLTSELESFRDRMIQEAKDWRQKHCDTVEVMNGGKQKNLDHQKEMMQLQVDALANHQRAIMNALSVVMVAQDVVPVYLQMLDKVSSSSCCSNSSSSSSSSSSGCCMILSYGHTNSLYSRSDIAYPLEPI